MSAAAEYVPYGPEWAKEVKKLPKDILIDWYRKALIQRETALDGLARCEMWLSTVPEGRVMQLACQEAITKAKGKEGA